MLTLKKLPPEFAFVEEGIKVEAESDRFWEDDPLTGSVAASVDLLFPSVQANYLDKYFDLEVMGEVLRFSFKATPSDSGSELRTWAIADTKAQFLVKLRDDLVDNYYLFSNYVITILAADAGIKLVARLPGDAYNVALDATNLTDLTEANLMSGQLAEPPSGYKVYFGLRKTENSAIIGEELVLLNSQGLARADFKAYARDLNKIGLSYPVNLPPVYTVVKHYEGIVSARLAYAEHYDGKIRKISLSNTLNIVPGGLAASEMSIVGNAYGFDVKTRFLAWGPNPKRTTADAPERLYIHVLDYFVIKATIHETDGTTTTVTLGDTDEPATYEIACGLKDIADMDPETVDYYTIDLYEDEGTVPTTETWKFVLDKTPRYNTRYFFFRNSFGVYELAILWGEMSEVVQYTRQNKEVASDMGYSIKPFKNERLATYKINSGYVTLTEKKWLQELLISKDVFWLENGWLIPVVVTNNEGNPITDKVFTHSVDVEFMLDMKDERYSILTSYLPGTHHLVTFDTQGGSFVAPQVIEHGGKVTEPADPVLQAQTFVSWKLDEITYDFNTEVTKSFSLVASYAKQSYQ